MSSNLASKFITGVTTDANHLPTGGSFDLALDGDDSTSWYWGSTTNTWYWQIDLGQPCEIDHYRLKTANNEGAEFSLWVSQDGTTYASLVAHIGAGDSGSVSLSGGPYQFRYARLYSGGTGVAQITYSAELIGVYGTGGTVPTGSGPPPSGGGGGGATPEEVAGALASWLSSDSTTNTQHGDLPWRTDANVSALKTLAEGSNGLAAIKGVVDAIATSVGTGLHTALTAIGTDVSAINTALTSHISSWSADLAATVQSWNDGLVDWFNKMGGLAGGPIGAISGRSAFPAELWTLVDEGDHLGPFVYDQAADLYVLTVTDADGQPPTVVDGVNWYPRIGWWCPFNGTQGADRRFWELGENQLVDGGRRMPGALVWTRPLVETHIQAWQLA